MSLAELLTAARALPRQEQLELARTLNDDAPPETACPETDDELLRRLMPSGSTFEVWSPLEAAEAAHSLLQLLADSREMK